MDEKVAAHKSDPGDSAICRERPQKRSTCTTDDNGCSNTVNLHNSPERTEIIEIDSAESKFEDNKALASNKKPYKSSEEAVNKKHKPSEDNSCNPSKANCSPLAKRPREESNDEGVGSPAKVIKVDDIEEEGAQQSGSATEVEIIDEDEDELKVSVCSQVDRTSPCPEADSRAPGKDPSPVRTTSLSHILAQCNGQLNSGAGASDVMITDENGAPVAFSTPYEGYQAEHNCYVADTHQYLSYNEQCNNTPDSCVYADAVKTLENLSASLGNNTDLNQALLEYALVGSPQQLSNLSVTDNGSMVVYAYPPDVQQQYYQGDGRSSKQTYTVLPESAITVAGTGTDVEGTPVAPIAVPGEHDEKSMGPPSSTEVPGIYQPVTSCGENTISHQQNPQIDNSPTKSAGSNITPSGREVLSTWKMRRGCGPLHSTPHPSAALGKVYVPVAGSTPGGNLVQPEYIPSTKQQVSLLPSRSILKTINSDTQTLITTSGNCSSSSNDSSDLGIGDSSISSIESPETATPKQYQWICNDSMIQYHNSASVFTPKAIAVTRQAAHYQIRNTPTLNSSGSDGAISPAEIGPKLLGYTPYNTPVDEGNSMPVNNIPRPEQLNAALIRAKENISPDPSEIGRHAHNAKERARRARIKTACENLREIIPGMNCKTDKATVFEFAVEYIKFLRQLTGPESYRYDKQFLREVSPYCD